MKKSTGGLYFFNSKVLPIYETVIFGPITIEIEAYDEIGINRIEYYIDEELKNINNEAPYKWYLNEYMIGKHKLEIIVYDNAGNSISESRIIQTFNVLGH